MPAISFVKEGARPSSLSTAKPNLSPRMGAESGPGKKAPVPQSDYFDDPESSERRLLNMFGVS